MITGSRREADITSAGRRGVMKRTGIMLAGSIAAVAMLAVSLQASPSRSGQSVVTGVIINISGDSVELKRGRTETIFYFTDATSYSAPGGAAADRTALGLCQSVRVTYIREGGRNVLVSVRIVRDGDCYRR
jgi:hypothetical protein